MQMPFCAIMRSWTLLAAFGGSYAPDCTDLRSTCIYSTYNTRGMSNMQLKGGPHGAWAGACRTSSGPDLVPRGRGGTTRFTWDILSAG